MNRSDCRLCFLTIGLTPAKINWQGLVESKLVQKLNKQVFSQQFNNSSSNLLAVIVNTVLRRIKLSGEHH